MTKRQYIHQLLTGNKILEPIFYKTVAETKIVADGYRSLKKETTDKKIPRYLTSKVLNMKYPSRKIINICLWIALLFVAFVCSGYIFRMIYDNFRLRELKAKEQQHLNSIESITICKNPSSFDFVAKTHGGEEGRFRCIRDKECLLDNSCKLWIANNGNNVCDTVGTEKLNVAIVWNTDTIEPCK